MARPDEDDSTTTRRIHQAAVAGLNEHEIAKLVDETPEHVVSVLTDFATQLDTRLATRDARAAALYAERLETLLKASWPKAMKGDIRAVETSRRLLEQQARLFGIDGQPDDTTPYDGPPLRLLGDDDDAVG